LSLGVGAGLYMPQVETRNLELGFYDAGARY